MNRVLAMAVGLTGLILALGAEVSEAESLDTRVSSALEFSSKNLADKALNTGLTFKWLNGVAVFGTARPQQHVRMSFG